MKKVLKTTGIILLILIIALIGWQIYSSRKPAAPTDYQTTVQTGGTIEAKYMADGPYKTARTEQPVLQDFKKYTLFYPEELASSQRTWPVIVLCNGSGTPVSKYPAVAEHYAS